MDINKEIRAVVSEFRAEDGDKPKIRGYVAVFGQLSDDLGGFREKVAPGAFKKTLSEARSSKSAERDIKALYSHETSFPLGSLQNGTLTLREDNHGLYAEIDPNMDDSDARNAIARIGRGDVNKASFAFRAVRQSWEEDAIPPVRTLEEVQLFEVSAGVAFPAYSQTAIEVRSNAQDGRFPLIKRYIPESEPDNHSEEPVQATPPEPEEVHSESEPREHSEATPYVPRDINILVKEWRLEVEAGRS